MGSIRAILSIWALISTVLEWGHQAPGHGKYVAATNQKYAYSCFCAGPLPCAEPQHQKIRGRTVEPQRGRDACRLSKSRVQHNSPQQSVPWNTVDYTKAPGLEKHFVSGIHLCCPWRNKTVHLQGAHLDKAWQVAMPLLKESLGPCDPRSQSSGFLIFTACLSKLESQRPMLPNIVRTKMAVTVWESRWCSLRVKSTSNTAMF